MILVIDIGNTTIEFGIYDKSELIGVFRLGSKRDISSDEVGLFASQFFDHRHILMSAIKDVIISSVVPQLNYSVTSAIKKYFVFATDLFKKVKQAAIYLEQNGNK